MTMKDWREAINKNISVKLLNFLQESEAGDPNASKEFLLLFKVLLPLFSKIFFVFTWVLISSQTVAFFISFVISLKTECVRI